MADNNTVIAASLELNADQASQTVKNFKDQLKTAQEKVVSLTEQFGATSKEVEEANKVVTRLKDNLNKIDTKGASASIDELKQDLKSAESNVISLTEQFGATSKEVIEANKVVLDLKENIKKINAKGASASIDELKQDLKSAESNVISLTEQFGATSKEVIEANKIVLDLKENIKKIDAKPATSSLKEFKQELKSAQADVVLLTEKFGATSKEAQNAAKKVADMQDQMADAKTLVDAFNPDKKFNGFAGALGAVTGGFAAVQGAMGLLGIESEDLQKQLLKVQSAMAVSQGLNSFLDSIASVKTFGKILVDTLGKSGLIGIAIAGVALLGAKLLGLFDKKVDLAAKTLNDSLKELAKGSQDATKEVLETKNAFEQARLGIISKEAALKKYNEGIGQTVGQAKDLNEAEKLLADNAANYVKVQGLKAQANYILGKSAELAGQAIIDQANIDKARAEGADKFAGGLGKAALDIAEKKIAETKKEAERMQGLVSGLNEQLKETAINFKPPPEKTEAKKTGGASAKDDPRIQLEKDVQAQLKKEKDEAALMAIADETERQKEAARQIFINEVTAIDEKFKAVTDKKGKQTEQDKRLLEQKAALLLGLETKLVADIAQIEDKKNKEIAVVQAKANEELLNQINANAASKLEAEQNAERASITNSTMSATEKATALAALELKFAEQREQARFEEEQKKINAEYEASVKVIGFTKDLETTKTAAILAAGEARDLAIAAAKVVSREKIAAEELKIKEAQAVLQIELDEFGMSNEEQKLANIEKWYQDKLKIVEKGSKQEAEVVAAHQKMLTDLEKTSQLDRLQAYGAALGAVADLVGKNTVAGKAMAVAQATINTYAAGAAVMKAAALSPGAAVPGYVIAQMVSVIAAGLISVRNIIKTPVPGKAGGTSGGGGNLSTSAISAPLAPRPQVATTALDQQSLNQIGNSTVRAFVIESDVTNNQERIRRLNRAARLGG